MIIFIQTARDNLSDIKVTESNFQSYDCKRVLEFRSQLNTEM